MNWTKHDEKLEALFDNGVALRKVIIGLSVALAIMLGIFYAVTPKVSNTSAGIESAERDY